MPVLAGLLLFIGFSLVSEKIKAIAGFALLFLGVALLTVVRFVEFDLTETFALLGSAALLTLLGASQASGYIAGPVSKLIGSKFSAVIVLIIGIPLLIIPPIGYVVIRTALASWGVTGKIAKLNTARNPHRTATTATALMVGIALIATVSIVGESIKVSVDDALSNSIDADLLISSESQDPNGSSFPTSLSESLLELPEVESVVDYKTSVPAFISIQGEGLSVQKLEDIKPDILDNLGPSASEESLRAIESQYSIDISIETAIGGEISEFEGHIDPEFISFDEELSSSEQSIYVSDTLAEDRDLKVGDSYFAVFLNQDVVELKVAGIFTNGFIKIISPNIINLETWSGPDLSKPRLEDKNSLLSVVTKDGSDLEESKAAITEFLKEEAPILQVQDRAEISEEAATQISQVLNVITVLLMLSGAIAILSIGIALTLAVFERTREIGLMRAIGTTRPQTRRSIRWEGAIVALFGGLFGLVLGIGLGVLAAQKLPESIVTTVSLPWGTIIGLALGAMIAGLLSAIFPAWRAGRMNVLEAISYE